MRSIIRYIDAHCALGLGIEQCLDQLLTNTKNLAQIPFTTQNDPVTLPYFSFPNAHKKNIYTHCEDACEKALEACDLSVDERKRTGVFLGSSCFDVQVSEQAYTTDLAKNGLANAVPMPIIGYGKLAARIQQKFSLSAHTYTYSTACSSSANALLNAHRFLQAGVIDHALVIGTESFNHTTLLGFHGLSLISPSAAMRPFEPERDGMLLGEALGILVLSNSQSTKKHSLNFGEFCGGATGVDNHSLTAASDDGIEISRALQASLQDAGITHKDIVAIKAHGTASLKSDDGEAAALARQFFKKIPQTFTLKPFCGHTLGGSGALETALTLGCLARGVLPGNPDLKTQNPMGVPLLSATSPAPLGYYLFNFFAFGGNNNSFVIERTEASL